MKRLVAMTLMSGALIGALALSGAAPAEARHHGPPVTYGYWDGFAYRPDLPAATPVVNPYAYNPYFNPYVNPYNTGYFPYWRHRR